MLKTLGRGLAPMASRSLSPFKRFNFTSTLPALATFERASNATTHNAAGKLIEVAANTPRFVHTADGTPLGLYLEPTSTNKCEGFNIDPTDTTGFTTNSLGVLSVVDDTAELAAAGLDTICTSGKVYKAQATSASTFIVYIPGTCGNINAHSLQFYARGTGTGGRTARISLGGATMDVAFIGTGYQLYKHENIVPSSTTRKFTISVDGNDTLYFILYQLEEGAECSSLIPVKGVSFTRPADKLYIDNIDQKKWFNPQQGYMICRYSQEKLLAVDSYAAVLNDGSSSNTIGLRLDQTDHNLRGYVRSNSSSQFVSANLDYQIEKNLNAAGIRWNANEVEILSGGEATQGAITQLPQNINTLNIGARNGGASPMHGHIQYVEVGTRNLSTKQLGQKLMMPNDVTIIGAGQSLIRGYFQSVESNSEAGKQKIREIMGHALRDSAIILSDGSTGSSAACKTSNISNFWWDIQTQSRGPAFDTFYNVINADGLKPNIVLWGQGEQDSHYINNGTSTADYKNALLAIFDDMRSNLGDIKIYIQPIGRRTSFSNTGGVQAIRDIQKEIIAENSWCYESAEIYDLELFDHVHINDASNLIAATRNSLSLLNQAGASGPRLSNALRSGTTITLDVIHDLGTDFSPLSGINGFRFFDDVNEISISNAVRTNATTITLTLSSLPVSSNKTLYYGYDDMAGINTAQIVRDNANLAMPLKTTKIIIN